jgi:nucleotidyltransferase/DNA polymerase involved in DNA repair
VPRADLAAAGARASTASARSAGDRLQAMGIRTIGELAARPVAELVEAFGRSYGRWLHEAAHGRDDRPVVTHSEPVSISRETTFERDLHAGARPRRALGALHRAVRAAWPRTCSRKGYVRAHGGHQAALRRLPHRHARPHRWRSPPPTRATSAAPPASA